MNPQAPMTITPRYFMYCRTCGDTRAHEIKAPRHRRHALFAALTFGLWLPGWLVLTLQGRRPRCRACGTRRALSKIKVSVAKTRPRNRVRVPGPLNDAA